MRAHGGSSRAPARFMAQNLGVVSDSPATIARRLIRSTPTATLATTHIEAGWPFASLVLVACRHDASPVLLISNLAEHTRNIAADPRVSLLFDGTAGLADRLTGARVSVLGRLHQSSEPGDRERFLARHTGAAMYANFSDFSFFRLEVTRAHLVAGFGKIEWIEPEDLIIANDPTALAQREADIVTHMNEDHRETIGLYATKLLRRAAGDWRMTGCDREGCDLASDADVARLEFPTPITDASEARAALVALATEARQRGM